MLVLLGISSVIAVILPNPQREARQQDSRMAPAEDADPQQDETDAGAGGAGGGSGTTAAATADRAPGKAAADQVTIGGSGQPTAVTLKPGGKARRVKGVAAGRLILTVEAGEPSQVTIPKLGRTGFADRWAPAVFDLVIPAAGEIPVYTAPPDGQHPSRRAVIIVNPPPDHKGGAE